MASKYDEATATEYSTLRMPYELLNQKYRNGQREMEKTRLGFQKEGTSLVDKTFGDGEETVSAEKANAALSSAIKSLDKANEVFNKSIDEQIELIDLIQKRIDFVQKGLRSEDNERHLWELRRIDKLVAEQLLRFGYLETAKTMVEESKTEGLVDIEIFETAAKVEEGLSRHDTSALKAWISHHRSKLRRIESSLEMHMWMQEAIEALKRGNRNEALSIMQKRVGEVSRGSHAERVMGLIACGGDTHIPCFREMLHDCQWDTLARNFRDDFVTVYQLPEHSAFSACLQAGLAAHKTPACKPKANPKCPTCDPIANALSLPLPYAHVSVSRLLCAHTGEPLNEDNVPIQLPSGYVYGEKSVEAHLRTGSSVRCSKTDIMYEMADAKKLFIL